MSPARAQPYGDSECQSKRESRKPPSLALLICLGVLPLWASQATGAVSQGASVVGISLGLPEMLHKSDHRQTKHHTWRVEELRFIKPVVLDKLTFWCLGARAQGGFYSYTVSTHNYSWHQLIGYPIAVGFWQLQNTGVAMGYMQEISKQKLIEAGTEYSILVRLSYGNSWLLGHHVPSSLSKNI